MDGSDNNLDIMFDFGIKVVNEVATGVVELSSDRPLGEEIGTVGAGGDLTKIGDDLSERIVKELINEFLETNNGYQIILIAEEMGLLKFGDANAKDGFFIILDPLDGSNNLRPWKTPSPFVSISLAMGSLETLEVNDNFAAIEVGIVRDIFNNRTYYAKKGDGAYVKGFGEINASPLTDVSESIVGIDFDKQQGEYDELYKKLEDVMKVKKNQRRLGSSILDMAKVACGEYDAYFSVANRMKIHDVAAIQLIINEADGVFELLEYAPKECLIKQIINSGDNSLIEANRFNIHTSGNVTLHKQFRKVLKST